MQIKIETTLITLGIIGVATFLIPILFLEEYPDFLRGGEPAAILSGVCMLCGFASILVFLTSLSRKKTKYWFLRTIAQLVFLLELGALAERV